MTAKIKLTLPHIEGNYFGMDCELTVSSFCERFKDRVGVDMSVFARASFLSIYINPQDTELLNELVQFCNILKLGFHYQGADGRVLISLEQPTKN
ncbi:hypothetical protein [Flagellimonas marina]|uniref:Uncharacterized protein n=1 Tax=Flagellimonas marina TaxID=1775168 RepID=A0ABV8PJG3_9FLAO